MEWEIIFEIVEKLEVVSIILEKKFVIKFNWVIFEIRVIVFLNQLVVEKKISEEVSWVFLDVIREMFKIDLKKVVILELGVLIVKYDVSKIFGNCDLFFEIYIFSYI